MASPSPSYLFSTGFQYANRATSDSSLDATTAFTVSITYDPESFGGNAANAIIVGKSRTDNNQRSWVIEHIQSDGTCRLSVFGSGDGTINATLKTSTAIRFRTNVTFTCSITAGTATLNTYINGTASNGTTTNVGTFGSGPYSSTEPLAMFAGNTSGTAISPLSGSIHMFAYLSYVASSGDISGMTATGVLNSTLGSSGNLIAYWRHSDITTTSGNDASTWLDTVGNLSLTFNKISGTVNLKGQASTGTAILICNQWKYTLTDAALGSSSLVTTYTDTTWTDPLYPHYRARVAGTQGAVEPRIASGYRNYPGDFTAAIRTRKFTGISQTYVLRRRGFLATCVYGNEFYAIVGDNGSGSTNKRISWGFNRFGTMALDSIIIFRYNAVEQDVDLFIGGLKYPQITVLTGQSGNEQTTGIFSSYDADWVFTFVVPTALSDAQIAQFVVGLSPLVVGPGADSSIPQTSSNTLATSPSTYNVIEDTIWPPNAILDPGWGSENVLIEDRLNTSQGFDPRGVVSLLGLGTLPYDTDPPLDDLDQFDPGDPLPVVVNATLSSGGAVTAIGSAGPFASVHCTTWWEIVVRTNEFIIQGDPVTTRDLFSQRLTFSDAFQLGPEFIGTGYNIVLAVQPLGNNTKIYRSSPISLVTVSLIDPNPTMISAVIDSSGNCVTTTDVNSTDAGNFNIWYEIEQTAGGNNYMRLSPVYTNRVFATPQTVNTTFTVGSRTGWEGKRIRFAMQVAATPAIMYYSNSLILLDWSYTWTMPTIIGTPTLTVSRSLTATGSAGPTNVGLCSTYWEIEAITGQVFIVGDRRTNIDFTSATNITDTFTIPFSGPVVGLALRFCVVPNEDATTTYQSISYLLNDPLITSPTPVITSANCSLSKLLTASVNIGTSNGGPATEQWEVLHDSSWESLFISTGTITLTSGQTRNLNHQLPSRLNLTNIQIRYRLISTSQVGVQWVSNSVTIAQVAVVAATPTITAANVDIAENFTASATISPSNLGIVDAQFEVSTQSDYKSVMESQSVTLSPTALTPVLANVPLPGILDFSTLYCRLVVRSQTFPELSYTSAPFSITQVVFSPPAMSVTVASQSASGILTLQGTIGVTSITSAKVWFEVDGITTGFDGIIGTQTGVNLTSGYALNSSTSIGRLSLNGKSVSIKFSATLTPGSIYSSSTAGISQSTFTDPAPSVTAANVDIYGQFTATSAAGPTDLGMCTTWLESSATGTFTELLDTRTSINLSGFRQTLNTSITLPTRFDMTGSSVKLVVQSNTYPDIIYKSPAFTVTVATLSPPSQTITSASISFAGAFTAQVILGANNLGTVKTWWESDISTPGVFTALLNTVSNFVLPAGGITVNGSATLPDRFDLSGKNVRFAIAPALKPEITYYSSLHAIATEGLSDPAATILSYTVNVWGDVSASWRAGPTNAGFCQVWFEINGISTSLDGIFNKTSSVNLISQQTGTVTFTLPRGEFQDPTGNYSYASKLLTFNVRPNNRAEQVFTSSSVSITPPSRINPNPTVLSPTLISGNTYTFSATTDASNLQTCIGWFEIDAGSLGIIRLPTLSTQDITNATTWSQTYTVPTGLNLISDDLYFVIEPVRDQLTQYRSAAYTLTDTGFDHGCTPQFSAAIPINTLTLVDYVPAPVDGVYYDIVITNGILSRSEKAHVTHDGLGHAFILLFDPIGSSTPVTLSVTWNNGIQLKALSTQTGWSVLGSRESLPG